MFTDGADGQSESHLVKQEGSHRDQQKRSIYHPVLPEKGFTDVKSMIGGIEAWSLTIDATVPRY